MTERRRTAFRAQTPDAADPLGRATKLARHFARNAKAPNSLRAYRAGWCDFVRWCRRAGRSPHPPDPVLVGLYLAHAAERLRLSTLRLRLAAIAFTYQMAGLALDRRDPALAAVLAGIVRSRRSPPRQKAPLLPPDLQACLEHLPPTPRGVRDRAILLVGWAAALRRSELVALDLGDAPVSAAGLQLSLRRSKTDAAGEGQQVIVLRGDGPICPVAALEAWIIRRGRTPGPLFLPVQKGGHVVHRRLSDKAVVRVIKAAVRAIGLDTSRFAGHSLRAGLVTSAHALGASLPTIARQTRHRSIASLDDYIRPLDLWRDNVTAALFDRK